MAPGAFRDTALRIIARIVILAIVVPDAEACYDSRFGEPPREETEISATETIAGLKERFLGRPFQVTGDIRVEGRVTSSDRGGNFYRTLCIEKEGAALEIMAGIDQLHNEYPVGCLVTLQLEGLTVAERLGVLQVGNAPQPGSGYDTDYIGSQAALDRVLIRRSEQLEEPVPTTLTIPELTVRRCGTLVRIEQLRYAPEEEKENAWSGYRRFVDAGGNTIRTYVREYADFASGKIPVEPVALVGILQYDDAGEGRFLIKPRDEMDCIR